MNVATKTTIVSVIDTNKSESTSKGECDGVNDKILIYDRDLVSIRSGNKNGVGYFNSLDDGGKH